MATGKHILLVDDEPALRQVYTRFLELGGYLVSCAADGYEALRRLRSGVQPCLILLDLNMPGMDGRQFRQEQLRDPALASVPVIVMSGTEDAGLPGVTTFLRKPFPALRLLEVVSLHC